MKNLSFTDLLVFGGLVLGASAAAYVVSRPVENENNDLLRDTFYCYRCHENHRLDHRHIIFRDSTHIAAKKSRTIDKETIRISALEV